MRIAVIGAGIAGNVAAARLHASHEVTVFEAAARVGGHTHTHELEVAGRQVSVDTGFIVYNERTYPRFTALLARLGVATQESSMSFSVRDEASGLEYNGTSLNALFAQRRNLVRPAFLGMVRDILRFNREAPELLERPADPVSLGDYLQANHYSPQFVEHYILPMGAAIWSAGTATLRNFPAVYFGILKTGAAVVPLNVLLKPREIAYHLRDSDATVAEDQGAGRLLAAMACVALDANGEEPRVLHPVTLFQGGDAGSSRLSRGENGDLRSGLIASNGSRWEELVAYRGSHDPA